MITDVMKILRAYMEAVIDDDYIVGDRCVETAEGLAPEETTELRRIANEILVRKGFTLPGDAT